MNTRKIHLDILRILANFLVLFNHTLGFALYQHAFTPLKIIGYTSIAAFTRINVPLFFMISGALLLSKEVELSKGLGKKILRFATLIVVANTFMYLLKFPASFSLKALVQGIFTNTCEGSYWYLYAHLAFLLLLPYLRRMVRDFTRKDFIYFLSVHFVIFTCIPCLDYVLRLTNGGGFTLYSEIQLPLMTVKAFFYPVLGYYLDTHLDVAALKKAAFAKAAIALTAGLVLTIGFTYHQGTAFGFTEDFLELFDYGFAMAVFVMVKYICTGFPLAARLPGVTKAITAIAPLTLGIYLLDPALVYTVKPSAEAFTQAILPTLLSSIAWCILSMVLGGLITWVLKKLPLFKQIL